MNKADTESSQSRGDFPEIVFPHEGSMEALILKMVIDALNGQGYLGLNPESLRSNAEHRDAAIDMLRDCRPMPVICSMIEKLENGEL